MRPAAPLMLANLGPPQTDPPLPIPPPRRQLGLALISPTMPPSAPADLRQA